MKKTKIVLFIILFLFPIAYAEELMLFWSFESGSGIWSVATSKGGEYVAAGSWDHNVYFFDSRGNLIWEYETQDSIWAVATSSGAEYVVAGSGDNNIYFLDVTGSLLWKYTAKDTIWAIDISDDGQYVVAGSYDDNVHFLQDGQPVWTYRTGDDVLAVATSADGGYVVAGSWDYSIYFFDSTGNLLWRYKTDGIVSTVAISEDGSYVIAGSHDNRVYTFDTSGRLLGKYRLSSNVLDVDISAGGEYFAVGSQDGKVYIFQLDRGSGAPAPGVLVGRFETGGEIWSIALSSDGSKVAAASVDNNIYVMDSSGTLLGKYGTGSRVTSVAMSADGERVAAGSYDNKVYFLNIQGPVVEEEKPPELPSLKVTRTGTSQNLIEGDYVTVKIEIKNVGGEEAIGVRMMDSVPEGLEIIGGESDWVGELMPGESSAISYTILAQEVEEDTIYEVPRLDVGYRDPRGVLYHAYAEPLTFFVTAKAPIVPIPGEEVPSQTEPGEGEAPPETGPEEEKKPAITLPTFTLPSLTLPRFTLPSLPKVERSLMAQVGIALLIAMAAIAVVRRSKRGYRMEKVKLLKHLKGEARGEVMPLQGLSIQPPSRSRIPVSLAPLRNMIGSIRIHNRRNAYREDNVDLLLQLKKEVGG